MAPPRFLHVFPSFNPGGAELRVSSIINYMGPGAGHAVLAIDGQFGAAYRLHDACRVTLHKGPEKHNLVQFFLDLRRQVREIQPRVLITYNWGAMDAVAAARLDGRGPVIHNECGLSNEFDKPRRRRAWTRRALLNGIYLTVVVSQTLRNIALTRFGVRPEKVRFIKTGVDTDRFQPRLNQELRGRIAPGAGGLIFGYTGTMKLTKNVATLVRAFAAVCRPEDRLALFGQGPLREDLEVLAKDLGIAGQVKFMGHFQDVSLCYGAMDIYTSASLAEQASNSLMEAMASGLPCIVNDIADNRIILPGSAGQFVIPPSTNESAFAAAMRTFAQSEPLRRQSAAANRRHCETDLSLERMLREYSSLWEDAARGARP